MYLKYKDADPRDTVRRIQRLFDSIQLRLDYRQERHINGVYTSWLTDSVCQWCTEGKGTTVDYCRASAYGEALEHLSTHYAFDISTVSPEARDYRGFRRYPDEALLPIERIRKLCADVALDMEEPYRRLQLPIPPEDRLNALWKGIMKDDRTPFVPFYHVNRGECVDLPDAVLSKLCGTNGGGSGNSPKEAIGHALDEIVERWSKYLIFSGRLTPPEVPDDYIGIRCPELLELKRQVERQGRMKVLVMDGSLGRGYPVLLVAVIDLPARRYLVNFGCHPQFEIALERCFTEIFQDRRVVPELLERREMAVWPNLHGADVHCQKNWTKLLVDDLGFWPEELFSTRPSWEFEPWREFPEYSNRIGMRSQLERLMEDGAQVYIRDVSFLGLPVYKVYIPGISISHIDYTEAILDDLDTAREMRLLLGGKLSAKAQERLGRRIFDQSSVMGRMFFNRLNNEEFDLLAASFFLEHGEEQEALERVKGWNGPEAELVAAVLALRQRMTGDEAKACARRFCDARMEALLDRFCSDHPFHSMLALYRYDGDSRRSMTGDDLQPARDALLMRVKDCMAAHVPVQGDISRLVSDN